MAITSQSGAWKLMAIDKSTAPNPEKTPLAVYLSQC
jgi:hypothetical protein